MSTNCVRCISGPRTGPDLICDECRKKYLSDIVVRFKEGHPHAGETGIPTGKTTGVGEKTLWEFTLLDCKHGIKGCFAGKDEAVIIKRKGLL